MKIIKADTQHDREITHLVSELISELVGKRFFVDESEARQFIKQSIENGNYTAFLAIDDIGKAQGIITVGECGAVYAGGLFGVIHEFFIAPELRSKGIGKQLIEEVKQTAIKRCWKRLEVGAPPYPDWRRTKRFYQREGFHEIGPRLRWMTNTTMIPDRCIEASHTANGSN